MLHSDSVTLTFYSPFVSLVESLSGLPLLVRGHVPGGGPSEISKPHFTKLLKQARLNFSLSSFFFLFSCSPYIFHHVYFSMMFILSYQVTNHISSISNIFVHDGAIGSSPKCDVKVRLISDNPSAMLSLSHMLWETPTRAVSQDSCPLTVYVATSIR